MTTAAGRPLISEGVVKAPPDPVWTALTTRDGQEGWMVAHSEIDLRVGGYMRTHYDPAGSIGDPGTIENQIICFDPGRMLSFRVTKAPDGFPFPDAIENMWTVIYVDPYGSGSTKVRVVGLGFTDGEESQRMREFFDRGNGLTVQALQNYFEKKHE